MARVFRNIVAGGFTGRAGAEPVGRPVSSGAGGEEHGRTGRNPSFLAFVCVPAAAVHAAVSSALAAGVRAICVI